MISNYCHVFEFFRGGECSDVFFMGGGLKIYWEGEFDVFAVV